MECLPFIFHLYFSLDTKTMENDGFVSSFFGNSNHFNSFPLFYFLFHLKNRNKNGINQAFKLGMYGADYVWILHEIIGEPWWYKTTHECSQKQLQEVSESLLIVSSHNSIASNEISFSGLVRVKIHTYILLFIFHLIIRLKSMLHFQCVYCSLNLSSNRFTINLLSSFFSSLFSSQFRFLLLAFQFIIKIDLLDVYRRIEFAVECVSAAIITLCGTNIRCSLGDCSVTKRRGS